MAAPFTLAPVSEAIEPSPPAEGRERRHLGGGALASTVSQVAVLAGGAVASIAIARILGPSGTGSFALAANFYAVALLVIGAGVKQGITVLVGSGRWPPAQAVGDLAGPLIVTGLIGAGLGLAVYEIGRDGFLDGIPGPAGPAIAAAIPFGIAWQWSWSLALARERYEAYAVLQTLPTILIVPICILLAAASGTTAMLLGYAGALVGTGVASLAWTLRRGRRGGGEGDLRSGGQSRGDGRRGRLIWAYRFGLLTWSSELLQFVNFRFDLFFLSAFAATSQVGIYSVAGTVTGISLVLPQALSVAVMPRSAALEGAAARGEVAPAEADLSDARAARHTLLLLPVSAAVVSLLLLVGIPLLYGSRFHHAIALGFILLPGTLALGLAKVYSAITMGRGRPKYALYTVLMTVPPTVVAYLLVIPDSGADGAAVVSTFSYLLTAVISFVFFLRVTRIRPRRALVPEREDLRAYPELATLSFDYLGSMRGVFVRSRSGREDGGRDG